jgi:6-phosphogluconolactonase
VSAHWFSYEDANVAAEHCAQQILARLEEALSGSGDATLGVSGGSTPKLLFEHLAAAEFNWNRVHLFWVDERAVPPTDPESNYKLAEDFLIKPGHFPHRNVHRVCGEMAPEKAARRYTEEIREFFRLDDSDLPHFDMLHFGTGEDAHTASLFPGDPLIDDREGIAAAVYGAKAPHWRITLLPGVLLAARNSVFLVAGEDKAEAVRNIFKAPYDAKKYPAQMITHHGRRVTWFLDKAAARLIAD